MVPIREVHHRGRRGKWSPIFWKNVGVLSFSGIFALLAGNCVERLFLEKWTSKKPLFYMFCTINELSGKNTENRACLFWIVGLVCCCFCAFRDLDGKTHNKAKESATLCRCRPGSPRQWPCSQRNATNIKPPLVGMLVPFIDLRNCIGVHSTVSIGDQRLSGLNTLSQSIYSEEQSYWQQFEQW